MADGEVRAVSDHALLIARFALNALGRALSAEAGQ